MPERLYDMCAQILVMISGNGIQQAAHSNAQDGENGTALHMTSRKAHEKVVLAPLEWTANANACRYNRDQIVALQAASSKGPDEVVRIQLSHGAEIDAQGGEHSTALQVAAFKSHSAAVRFLIEIGSYGTLLELSWERAHRSIVRILLDVTTIDQLESMLLRIVAWNLSTRDLQTLIDGITDISRKNSAGRLLTNFAARKGRLDVTKLLIRHGAGVSIVDNGVWPLLVHAADEGAFAELLERRAGVKIMSRLASFYSPAATEGHLQITGRSLNSNMKLNGHDAEVNNAFRRAWHKGHHEFLQIQSARASKHRGQLSVAYSESHVAERSSRHIPHIAEECEDADLQTVDDDIFDYGFYDVLLAIIWKIPYEYLQTLSKHLPVDCGQGHDRSVLALKEVSRLRIHSSPLMLMWKQHYDRFKTRLAYSKYSPDTILHEQLLRNKAGSHMAIRPAVPKQRKSRVSEFMVWSGLIPGPLQAGYTRITWKNVRL